MKNSNCNLRPVFHITGGNGWINDPNGLVIFKNRYHVFYQFHPYGVKWGPMHWGHVVSDDLTSWETLPIALTPDKEYDKDGCFSGGAIVWRDRLWLMYTGYNESRDGNEARQIQCLASSEDGVSFIKHGVVIGENELPEGYALCDFRDPKVWSEHGEFWCAVAGRKYGGRGRILLFCSDDMFKWEFVSDITDTDSKGIMTECPDYREDIGLLTYCEQYQPCENNLHLNIHTTRWFAGRLDYNSGKFGYAKSGIVDYGFDFYAPQTFNDEPVMIGWLNMWERSNPSEKYGFAGMLTVPRRVEIRNGELWQSPAVKCVKAFSKSVNGSLSDNIKVGLVKIEAENLSALSLKMRKKGEDFAEFKLENGEWVFDRSHCGEKIAGGEKDKDSLAGIRRMPFTGGKNTGLTVVFDEFSIEIFADGKALSSVVYPDADADGLELSVTADACDYSHYGIKN